MSATSRVRTSVSLSNNAWRNPASLPFLAVLILLSLAVTACVAAQPASVVALPNGYYMQPDKKAQVSIVKRGGGAVVRGPIAAYAVYRHVVTGALGAPSPASRSYTNDLPFQGGPDTRFFVLDTSTGKLESDLTADAWMQRLKEIGAPSSLEIYAPILLQ